VRHFLKLSITSVIAGGTIFLAQGAAAAGPAASWNGCYAGVQGGAATSTSRWKYNNSNFYDSTGNTDPQQIPGVNFNDTRGVIGAQAGCNRAIGDWWVIGIEGGWLSNPMNEHNTKPGFFPGPFPFSEVVTTNIQSIASVTGRLGVAPSANWLLYGKGGYAAARIDTSGSITPALGDDELDFTTTNWHNGWTAGAGFEYRLFRNVTVGLEYDYYRFDNVQHVGSVSAVDFDASGNPRPASPILHSVNASTQTLMARFNVAFDTPGTTDGGPYAAYAAYVKAPPLAPPVSSYSGFVTSEVRDSSWSGGRGVNVFAADPGSGYQVFSPTTIGVDYLMPSQYKLETRIKGGYVYAASTTFGQQARYEGPVDTQTAFNLTLLNYDSIRPLFGLNLNLPTGNTYLPNGQRFTRMDPDLVDIGSYGVGFNINPTAGFIIGVDEHTAVSLSAGWMWQGDFTRDGVSIVPLVVNAHETSETSTTDLKQKVSPGNTYTLNGNVSSTFGSLSLNESFAYMGDSHASIDGISTGRAGARFTANFYALYSFDPKTALGANVSWSFSEKNDIPNTNSALFTEPSNSNSNLIIGSVDPSYMLTDRLRIAANYSFLWRDHNFYDPFQEQFISAKQKHTVGASTTYAVTDKATLTFRASRSWVRQENGAFVAAAEDVPAFEPPLLKYDVWAGSVAASISF
jgi:opacity protein-like surface antigen